MKFLYLDCETTGLDPAVDRIVELCMVLCEEEGAEEIGRLDELINPGISIPAEVTKIHGIADADVAGKRPFSEHIPRILDMVQQCDAMAGYNVNFDLRAIQAESLRCDQVIPMYDKRIFDMQKIFFHHEPRDLTAALRFYCDRKLDGAHRARPDVEATVDIFRAQCERYKFSPKGVGPDHYAVVQPPLDSNGAFEFNQDGQIILRFGKYKGKVADCTNMEIRNYLSWMVGARFPPDSKNLAKALCRGKEIHAGNIADILKGRQKN